MRVPEASHDNRGALYALVALALTSLVALALVFTGDPRGPILLIAAAAGAGIALVLIEEPRLTLLWALLLYIVPFGLRPDALEPLYTFGQAGLILLGALAWALAWSRGRASIVWSPVYALVALYMAWAVISLLWAPDLVEARRKLVSYGLGLVMLFLLVQQVRTLRDIDAVMLVLAAVGWMVIAAGLAALLASGYHFDHRLRMFGMNENETGIFLAATAPGALWTALRAGPRWRRAALLTAVAFLATSLVLTVANGSRSGSLSILAMMAVLGYRRPMRRWAVGGAVGITILFLAAPFLVKPLADRATERHWGGELGGRLVLWKASADLISDYPFTGAGIGYGRFALNRYIRARTSDYNHRNELTSHNPFFEVGIDTGIPGMILYAAICAAAVGGFVSGWRRWVRLDPLMPFYAAIVSAGTIGFSITFVKDGGLESSPTVFVVLALLAIPACLRASPAPRREPP